MQRRRIPDLIRRPNARFGEVSGGPAVPQPVWYTLENMAGYTFTRSSSATDGLPEVGLPANDIDSYGSNVIREVSAKAGRSVPTYLLEGARQNIVLRSLSPAEAGWGPVGSAVITGGQADPMGGTSAARVESPSGNNMYLTTTVSPPMVLSTNSAFVRSGPGTGVYQVSVTNPGVSRGGTAGADWQRVILNSTPTANVQQRAADGGNRLSEGGLAAGARDAIYYGFQMESAPFPTSYIPTTGTAATRANDIASVILIDEWITGVLLVEYIPAYSSAQMTTSTPLIYYNGTNYLTLLNGVTPTFRGGLGNYNTPTLTFSAGDLLRFEIDWDNLTLTTYKNGVLDGTVGIVGSWTAGWQIYLGNTSTGTAPTFGLLSYGRSALPAWNFSQAESAAMLPNTAVWVSTEGVTQSGTVTQWDSSYGGVSCTLTPPTSANEPTYNATGGVGGRPSVTFNGTNDFLRGTFTKGSAFENHEVGIVGERVAFGTLGDIWFGYWLPNSAAFYLNDQDASRFRFTSLGAANAAPSSTYDPDGVLAHYSGDGNNTNSIVSARVNGVAVAIAAGTITSRADGNTVLMGASQTATVGPYGTVAANIVVHAAHLGPALTPTQRIYLRALLTNKTGVSC